MKLKNGLICILLIVFAIAIGSKVTSFNKVFSSPFSDLTRKDFNNFINIGEQLFSLYDEHYVLGTIYYKSFGDYPKVKKVISKYNDKIAAIYFVDKNVILLSFGPVFQSVDGIAVKRNDAELKDTYGITGFDDGTLEYTELIPNVYRFVAGL